MQFIGMTALHPTRVHIDRKGGMAGGQTSVLEWIYSFECRERQDSACSGVFRSDVPHTHRNLVPWILKRSVLPGNVASDCHCCKIISCMLKNQTNDTTARKKEIMILKLLTIVYKYFNNILCSNRTSVLIYSPLCVYSPIWLFFGTACFASVFFYDT